MELCQTRFHMASLDHRIRAFLATEEPQILYKNYAKIIPKIRNFDVRFTPESRHSEGRREMSAFDPERTLRVMRLVSV